jgi:hypothetical protein
LIFYNIERYEKNEFIVMFEENKLTFFSSDERNHGIKQLKIKRLVVS